MTSAPAFTEAEIDDLIDLYRSRATPAGRALDSVGEVLTSLGFLLITCSCGDREVAECELDDVEFAHQHSGCAETARIAARFWLAGDRVCFTDHLGTFHTGQVITRFATIDQARSINLFETLSDLDGSVHLMRRDDLDHDAA